MVVHHISRRNGASARLISECGHWKVLSSHDTGQFSRPRSRLSLLMGHGTSTDSVRYSSKKLIVF